MTILTRVPICGADIKRNEPHSFTFDSSLLIAFERQISRDSLLD
jgi:hypothetical protein